MEFKKFEGRLHEIVIVVEDGIERETAKLHSHSFFGRSRPYSHKSYGTCVCGMHQSTEKVIVDPNKKVGKAYKRCQHRGISK